MKTTRRQWATAVGALPLAGAQGQSAAPRLPLKAAFAVTGAETCLNNARWHPISTGAARAVRDYLDYKASGGGAAPDYGGSIQRRAKALFAGLINARPSEIAFIPSTLAGENLVVSGLGLPTAGGNVVTDALHFEGSLYLYGAMERQGLEVRTVRPREWRIRLEDVEKAVDRNTRLVAISQVSMLNGFEHDLKAVCEIAHARGAVVFADVVQAAGATPIDVRASGVDFCACSSYKWLMGDMGLGFLYVREELLGRVIRRSQYGYRQLSKMDYHLFPYDPPGGSIFEWEQTHDAAGHFEVGTISNTTAACLTYSLALIQRIGVERIVEHRRPMLARLREQMPRLGFTPLTPPDSQSPIIAFAAKDTARLEKRLRAAKVDIAVYPGRIRISPSIYNDMADVDRLLSLLG